MGVEGQLLNGGREQLLRRDEGVVVIEGEEGARTTIEGKEGVQSFRDRRVTVEEEEGRVVVEEGEASVEGSGGAVVKGRRSKGGYRRGRGGNR